MHRETAPMSCFAPPIDIDIDSLHRLVDLPGTRVSSRTDPSSFVDSKAKSTAMSYLSVEPEYDQPQLRLQDDHSYMAVEPDDVESPRLDYVNPPLEQPKLEFVNPPFEQPNLEFVNPPLEQPTLEFINPPFLQNAEETEPPYVHDSMDRAVAERSLKQFGGNGTFLLRRKDTKTLVLSLHAGDRFWHWIIGEGSIYTFDHSTLIFGEVETLDEMIQSMREPRNGWSNPLLQPVTRRMLSDGVDDEYQHKWDGDGVVIKHDTYMSVLTEPARARLAQKKAAASRMTRSQSVSATRTTVPPRTSSLQKTSQSQPQQRRSTVSVRRNDDGLPTPTQIPHQMYHERSSSVSAGGGGGISRHNRENSFVHKDMKKARMQFELLKQKREQQQHHHHHQQQQQQQPRNAQATNTNVDPEPLYDQQRHPSVSSSSSSANVHNHTQPSQSQSRVASYNPNTTPYDVDHEPLYDQQRHTISAPHQQQQTQQHYHHHQQQQQQQRRRQQPHQHGQQQQQGQHHHQQQHQGQQNQRQAQQSVFTPQQWEEPAIIGKQLKTPARQYPPRQEGRPTSKYIHEPLYDQQGSKSIGSTGSGSAYQTAHSLKQSSTPSSVVYQPDNIAGVGSLTISMPGESHHNIDPSYARAQRKPSSMSPPPVPLSSHPKLANRRRIDDLNQELGISIETDKNAKKKRSKVGSMFSSIKRKPKEKSSLAAKPALAIRSFSQVTFLGSTMVDGSTGVETCLSAIQEMQRDRQSIPQSCEIAILPTHLSIADSSGAELHYVALDDLTFGFTDADNESLFAIIHSSNASTGFTCVVMQADGFSGADLMKKLEIALTAANLPIEYDGPDTIRLNSMATVNSNSAC